MKKFGKLLISFVGKQDPLNKKGESGPILNILENISDIDSVILLSNFETEERISHFKKLVKEFNSKIKISDEYLNISNPTDYSDILNYLRIFLQRFNSEINNYNEVLVNLSSGTPQMQTCWLLLAASEELNAFLIHANDPAKSKEIISYIDPKILELPHIKPFITPDYIEEIDEGDYLKIAQNVGIITRNENIKNLLKRLYMFAQHDVDIMLLGETGTGKELFAKFIHHCSKRRRRSFVPINIVEIPETLLEARLFGHTKGAFTGADKERAGFFEQAHNGTIFLDEIGELQLNLQVKLLRVLQERTFYKVGETIPKKIDIRVIAATNRNIKEEVINNNFRKDLFYRFVEYVTIPSLKERKDDIIFIAEHFLKKYSGKTKNFTEKALYRLTEYNWPGNIRELEHCIMRAAILSEKDVVVDSHHLTFLNITDESSNINTDEISFENFEINRYLNAIEKQLVIKALNKSRNKAEAANKLGVTPQALQKKLKKYNLK